ncbi:hypothetical protein BY458DRAFT_555868 [Sporodiniella umbellata]|nr:hypothetical protein BY458DRAFT_555868 [Sporodiniella umbellata]
MPEKPIDKRTIPNYILLPFALLKSQLFWLYSAICWVFQNKVEPENTQEETIPKESKEIPQEKTEKDMAGPRGRSRSRSEPPAPNTAVYSAERRASLSSVQERPTRQDERTGTTCPPVWWQKTRIKLGHTPIHHHDHFSGRSKRKMLAKLLHRKEHQTPMVVNHS